MGFSDIFQKSKKKFVFQQGLFWLISIILFTVVLIYTRGDFNFYNINLRLAVNILITVGFLALSVYINLLWLIPVFFNKRKFLLFTFLELANIILFILLNYYVTYFFEGGKQPTNFLTEFIAELILVLLFLIVSTLLKFMRDSIALQDVELRMKEVEKQKIEAELMALKAQVNPHFFFNTLNTLSYLISQDQAKSQLYLNKLSYVLRTSIELQQSDLILLTEEIKLAEAYFHLLSIRFGGNVMLVIHAEDAGQYSVPPMTLQMLIENAIKHNVISTGQPLRIEITLDKENKSLTISNNLQLKVDARGAGIGLKNLDERFRMLAGRSPEIFNKDGQFTVTIPLISA